MVRVRAQFVKIECIDRIGALAVRLPEQHVGKAQNDVGQVGRRARHSALPRRKIRGIQRDGFADITMESGDRTAAQDRVLVATQNSDFKQAVIQAIRDRLENNSNYIKVIDVKKLPYESTEGYDAVIILNTCMAGRPDPRVESFIDDSTEKEKIVVLTTGRLDSWKPESPRVDAMSSASVMTQAATIGQLLAEKVLEIIRQKNI